MKDIILTLLVYFWLLLPFSSCSFLIVLRTLKWYYRYIIVIISYFIVDVSILWLVGKFNSNTLLSIFETELFQIDDLDISIAILLKFNELIFILLIILFVIIELFYSRLNKSSLLKSKECD